MLTDGSGERCAEAVVVVDGRLRPVLRGEQQAAAHAQHCAFEPGRERRALDGRVELARADLGRQRRHVVEVLVPPDLAARVAIRVRQPATQRQPYWSSYIGCRLSKELHIQAVSVHASHPHWTSTTVPARLCVSAVSVLSGRYRLRSTGSADYVLPRTRTRFGERGFSYCGRAAWNTLPSDLHDITDTGTFRKRLKSVLYDRACH